MKMRNVMTLLWKDVRLSRLVFLGGVIMWPMPMWFTLAVVCKLYMIDPAASGRSLARIAGQGVTACMMLSGLMVAMVVGHLMTSERADRSSAFLSYLPFSRREALVSKIMTALALATAFLLLNIVLRAVVLHFTDMGSYWREYIIVMLACGTLIFGSTWLAGTCFRSGAIATAAGLAVPIALWMSLWLSHFEEPTGLFLLFVTWSVGLGVFFFIAGSTVFLKQRPEG